MSPLHLAKHKSVHPLFPAAEVTETPHELYSIGPTFPGYTVATYV